MDSGAAGSPQSRVAGNRDLSGLRIRVRNGDGRRRAVRCAIHMVPCIWRASGGLVGGPALAAENELARRADEPLARDDIGVSSDSIVIQREDVRPHSRGAMRPSFASIATLDNKRAQGKPGARCTRGLVCKHAQKNAHEHTGSAEASRPSLRNGLRLTPRSPR
jgi:hypothetical protein